jgi:hypothetical protein
LNQFKINFSSHPYSPIHFGPRINLAQSKAGYVFLFLFSRPRRVSFWPTKPFGIPSAHRPSSSLASCCHRSSGQEPPHHCLPHAPLRSTKTASPSSPLLYPFCFPSPSTSVTGAIIAIKTRRHRTPFTSLDRLPPLLPVL